MPHADADAAAVAGESFPDCYIRYFLLIGKFLI
jgi:hypothetical protein